MDRAPPTVRQCLQPDQRAIEFKSFRRKIRSQKTLTELYAVLEVPAIDIRCNEVITFFPSKKLQNNHPHSNFRTQSDIMDSIPPHIVCGKDEQPLLARESLPLHHGASVHISAPTTSPRDCDCHIQAAWESVPASRAHDIVHWDFDFIYRDVKRGRIC